MYPLALREGLFGGFFLGISLGILWIPSVGPILGSVLAYIATSENAFTLSYGAVLLIVYFLGFSIPVLIIVYLVKMISNNLGWSLKRSVLIKKLSGLVLILVGLIMLLGIDRYLQVLLLPYWPFHV
jgi:cytochrome c biogenesis protein CcdA